MSVYAVISTTSTEKLKGKRRIKLTFSTSMLAREEFAGE